MTQKADASLTEKHEDLSLFYSTHIETTIRKIALSRKCTVWYFAEGVTHTFTMSNLPRRSAPEYCFCNRLIVKIQRIVIRPTLLVRSRTFCDPKST